MTMGIDPGQSVYVSSGAAQELRYTWSRFGSYHPLATRTAPLQTDVVTRFAPPDLGDQGAWHLRLAPTSSGSVLLCVG